MERSYPILEDKKGKERGGVGTKGVGRLGRDLDMWGGAEKSGNGISGKSGCRGRGKCWSTNLFNSGSKGTVKSGNPAGVKREGRNK